MENASKALLIAGSILIAIILIAIAVRIIQANKPQIQSVEDNMSATEKATFNSKFIKYYGNNKTKGTVLALINEAIASNANSDKQVTINGGTPRYSTNYIWFNHIYFF